MHILFLFKRYYMGKDVVADRYGRLFEFPYFLARSGHQVTCLLSDYHFRAGSSSPLLQDGVSWITIPASRPDKLVLAGRRLAAKADIVMGSSDSLQVALASYLARKYHLPCVVDLYDNYESFGLTRLPFLRPFYRRSVETASAVTCVGSELGKMVSERYSPMGPVVSLNSTVPAGKFFPMEQKIAREALGLPVNGKLVGICGGLDSTRGIGFVYRALEQLWRDGDDCTLVLAGNLDPREPAPVSSGKLIHLGPIDFGLMNAFYSAMDVNLLQYIDNEFGRYAYPQKLDEVLATKSTLMAANVGELKQRFRESPGLLYGSSDVTSIVSMIRRQLADPVPYVAEPQNWDTVGAELEHLLCDLAAGTPVR